MSKNDMPESMDLLLDTMCNTFGGVMFITLTLVLTLFVSQHTFKKEDQVKKIQKEIKTVRQEIQKLQREKANQQKRLSMLKDHTFQDDRPSAGEVETVVKLELERKNQQYDIENLKREYQRIRRKNKDITKNIQEHKSRLENREKSLDRQSKKLKKDQQHQAFIIKNLKIQLEKTPVRKIHFARNKGTDKSPYFVFIKDEQLYRLGLNAENPARDVSVTITGRKLYYTLKNGLYLTFAKEKELHNLFPGFDRSRHFFFILIAPNSIASFVDFRRKLRKNSCDTYWNITEEFVLQYTSTNYSASQ